MDVRFWGKQAARLDWDRPFDTVHNPGTETWPRGTWFDGGELNVAANCLDRHVRSGAGSRVALHFEGEPGDRQTWTYADLQREVARAANALESLGVRAGDRVIIYLPVLVETIVATLACARIGAIHSLVFGGFSAEALRFRLLDTGAKVLITSDGQYRRGVPVQVKSIADEALQGVRTVERVLVVRRTSKPGTAQQRSKDESRLPWTPGRDAWWHEALAAEPDTHAAAAFPAETPLLIVYTSGTTGKPKGLVHTMGGYLVQTAYTHALLFDLVPELDGEAPAPDETSAAIDPAKLNSTVHWCTADLAWVTAHTYAIYGPLVNGVTQVIYEGTPTSPHPGRHFEIIERYGVTNYYTAPTLVRTLMRHFPGGVPAVYDLSSVRLVGTVGESVNPAAWEWLHREVAGGGSVPFIDTWWQSETGSAVMSPRPGDFRVNPATGEPVRRLKPGRAGRALPGLSTRIVDEAGQSVEAGVPGTLVIDQTGPSLARTVWGDPARYHSAYLDRYPGWFLSGDGAVYDEDGDIRVTGRLDDVINVSGHRLSTIEIESALVAHPYVVEAGVAPVSDPSTGHAALACVVLTEEARRLPREGLAETLRGHVAAVIGPIAKPAHVLGVPDVPKTRSGKIMRRLLGDIFEGRETGDTTSLQNAESLAGIVAALRPGA